MRFSISTICSPRWWDKLQSRGHKLSSVIAETLPFWVNLPAAELETITKMDAVVSPRSQLAGVRLLKRAKSFFE
jgi:hypothetical protein